MGLRHRRRRGHRPRLRHRRGLPRLPDAPPRAARLRQGHVQPLARSSSTAASATSSRATSPSCSRRSRSAAACSTTRPTSSTTSPFVVPNYAWWEGPFYGIGMKMYDLLAGRSGFGRSKHLSKEETLERLPTIEPDGLDGGVIYYDGQFDDARLAVNMAQTAAEQGGVLLNYCEVTGLLKNGDEVAGVRARDAETGGEFEIRGPRRHQRDGRLDRHRPPHGRPDARARWCRRARASTSSSTRRSCPATPPSWSPRPTTAASSSPSRGTTAWSIGTTDTPVDHAELEPRPLDEELEFLLEPRRPLPHPGPDAGRRPQHRSPASARSSARRTTRAARPRSRATTRSTSPPPASSPSPAASGRRTARWPRTPSTRPRRSPASTTGACVTKDLRIHGYHQNAEAFGDLHQYGSDAPRIQDLIREDAALRRTPPSRPDRPSPRRSSGPSAHEMARTVEDVLVAAHADAAARRPRQHRDGAAPWPPLMAEELGRDEAWQREQVETYTALAHGYIIADGTLKTKDIAEV